MQMFFQNECAEIYYDDVLDTLFLKYLNKVQNTEKFIEINSQLLAAFRQLDTQKFVADIRKMGIISIESQNWVVENLIPGMFRHLNGRPLFHAQLIDPSEVMSKVSGSNIKSRAKKEDEGFVVHQFTAENELTDYLNSL